MKTTNLRWITLNMDYLRVPLNATERAELPGSIPYWGANGVVDYVNDSVLDERVILIGEDGAPFFERDKDVAFISEGEAWINNHIHILKPDERVIHDRFLKYFLNQVDYSLYINGSTRDKLTQSQLGNISVSYPDLPTQRAIADFLDREIARIDLLIEKKQRLVALLGEKVAVQTRGIVTGRNQGTDDETAYLESRWFGKFPKQWELTKAKFVSRTLIPQRTKPELNDTVGLPWVTADYLQEDEILRGGTKYFISTGAISEAASSVFPKDTVLASCVGIFGKATISRVDCVPNQQIQGFLCSRRMLPKYLLELVRICRPYFDMVATSTTIRYVNRQGFENMPVLLPSINEQESIVSELEEHKRKHRALTSLVLNSIDRLKEYRSALITAAVTGQVDVSTYAKSGATVRHTDAIQEEMGA